MKTRGAPAIGIAAAYGLVLAASGGIEGVMKGADRLASTRPTAVNLFWALERMKKYAREKTGTGDLRDLLLKEADLILEEDIEANRNIGKNGQVLLPESCSVLSHCNAGALATGGYGTALGVLRAARDAGKNVTVFLDETRPLFQGSRLSAWELMMDGFDVTVICDGMAAWLMKSRGVDAVIVGADRIASNGDFANKIGTYGLAVAAKEHSVPFYVAAPSSTIDSSIESGEDILIEERKEEEIRLLPGGMRLPEGVGVWNPAFDITPADLVTAHITERGLFRPPFSFHI
jgi:methylthioribose-1-phosphate isomerase